MLFICISINQSIHVEHTGHDNVEELSINTTILLAPHIWEEEDETHAIFIDGKDLQADPTGFLHLA